MTFPRPGSLVLLLVLASPILGLAFTPTAVAVRGSRLTLGSHPDMNQGPDSISCLDDDSASKKTWTPREARLHLPLAFLSASLLWPTPPAYAGIGTVIPFEVTRARKYAGSIANTVVGLRLKSTLRKQLGYYSNKAVVATVKPGDDLSRLVASEFGDGSVLELAGSGAIGNYLKDQLGGKKAFILFGQDVSISREGDVSETTGADISSQEKLVLEAVASAKTEADVVVMGGITIHRSKSGGKDAGEDCFYPVSMLSIRGGVVTDIFPQVYGDLPTPRQSVVLK